MKRLFIALTFVFTMTVAAELSAQSLADLAKQEKERRAKVTADTKVITNNVGAGNAGTLVTLSGSGFTSVTGVKFSSGLTAAFTVLNDATLTATVPAGAVTA